jgi:hypothetical protein
LQDELRAGECNRISECKRIPVTANMRASCASRFCDVCVGSCVVDLLERFDLDGPRMRIS